MNSNNYYEYLSKKSMDIANGSYNNVSLMDNANIFSPYRELEIDEIRNWIPVVLRLMKHNESNSFIGYVPCLIRAFPKVVHSSRGYMIGNQTCLSSEYIEDLEFVFNDRYFNSLVKANHIDSHVYDEFDNKVSRSATDNDINSRFVDIDIYPFFFHYKSYFSTNGDWNDEMTACHIVNNSYSVLKKNNLPYIHVNKVLLGDRTYICPMKNYGINRIVNIVSAKAFESNYSYVDPSMKNNNKDVIDVTSKFFEDAKITMDKKEIINHKILVYGETLNDKKDKKYDEILDDDLLL